MRYIFIVLSVFIFFGCTTKKVTFVNEEDVKVKEPVEKIEPVEIKQIETKPEDVESKKVTIEKPTIIKKDKNSIDEAYSKITIKSDIEIYDLLNIPQDVNYYLKKTSDKTFFYDIQNKYEKRYFGIWNIDKANKSLSTAKWAFNSYRKGNSYGENLQLLKQSFFDEMLDSANFDNYSKVNEKALVLKDTNIRAFPTNRPLLKDPTLAGEGFPFDYLQNSSIAANKPILISHYSKNREWAHIFSGFAFGWIKVDELVIIDKVYRDKWQKAQQVRIIKDGVSIYDEDGEFLFKSRVGMMFALVAKDSKSYTILTVSLQKGNKPLFIKSKISKDIARKEVLGLTRENLEKIIKEVSKTNYGWGGMYEQRDCSSMLRDLFAPFGIWLPRNSSQQSKIGKVISFKGMSDEQKIRLIKDRAIPFQTLLYKGGHIALYVGTHDDKVVIFHNTWGIKTKKDGVDGRVIIGKPIFSSLKLGEYQNNYDEEAEILRNLKSMNILTQ